MKACIIADKGKVKYVKKHPEAPLAAGEVRVQVKAAALNHRDVWISQGLYAGIRYPIVPGSDGAGIVTELGKGVDARWMGREVVLNPSSHWGDDPRFQGPAYEILGLPRDGTLAETVVVTAGNLYEKPAHLSWEQAAALPLAGLTAYRALMARAGLRRGEKVLITGIGGGVALLGLQFAAAAGNEVWVSSSADTKINKAVSLGARGGARYDQQEWVAQLKEKAGLFDVILDGAAGPGFGALTDLAAPGGRIVIYGGTRGKIEGLVPQRIFWKQISILGSTMGHADDFRGMMDFVNAHKLIPVVDEVFPLEEAAEAFDKMANGQQFGKIVLSIP